MSVDYDKIKRLITLVEQNKLTELAVEEEDFRISIEAETSPAERVVAAVPLAQPGVQVEMQAEPEMLLEDMEAEVGIEEAPSGDLVEIESPMIGVFYRRPTPDSPQFIEIGDEIEVGQTIGLIEAMKVFSEVPAEVAGRVVALPVESGKLVQQGDVLVVVDVSKVS